MPLETSGGRSGVDTYQHCREILGSALTIIRRCGHISSWYDHVRGGYVVNVRLSSETIDAIIDIFQRELPGAARGQALLIALDNMLHIENQLAAPESIRNFVGFLVKEFVRQVKALIQGKPLLPPVSPSKRDLAESAREWGTLTGLLHMVKKLEEIQRGPETCLPTETSAKASRQGAETSATLPPDATPPSLRSAHRKAPERP